MKVGTVPKIVVGVAALIALVFIGFVGVRQMNAPTVEERVYLSPWEDGTARPRNNSEDLAAQTDSAQDTGLRDNQSQNSAAEIELIDDFWDQSEETDTTQLAIDAEFEIDANQDLFAEISTLLDDEGQSAEDVMNAFLEALRSLDAERIRTLMTGTAKGKYESTILLLLNGELPKETVDMYYSLTHDMLPAGKADEMLDKMIRGTKEMIRPVLEQTLGQAEIVSSEHVGDELHFRMSIPLPGMSGVSGVEMPDVFHKIRKENGMWRIYDLP